MKRSILLFAFVLFCVGLQAQGITSEPVQEPALPIEFNEKTHDFGDLEYGAPTQFLFKFKNISDEPIALKGVKASCGCTTPNWTKEAVAPGEEGEIKVSYNSKRVGPFNKSIRVTYDSASAPVVIYIKGKVGPQPEPPAADPSNNIQPMDNTVGTVDLNQLGTKVPKAESKFITLSEDLNKKYAVRRGSLAFEKLYENVNEIASNEQAEISFAFLNISKNPIKLLPNTVVDPEVEIAFSKDVVESGEKGEVTVLLNGNEFAKAGHFTKRIKFFTDEDAPLNSKDLTIAGMLNKVVEPEPVKAITPVLAASGSAPTISFVEVDVDGGTILEGEQFIYDFEFKNTGKGDLVIESAKASCGCTASKPTQDKIAPGESAAITATFNSRGRSGKQSKSITVRSNDPENPTKVLKFTVQVEKDPFHAANVGPAAAPEK